MPCAPNISIFSSGFPGSGSSAALQLRDNPAEASLMISRGGFFYISFPTYQCAFKVQNPCLTSSFLFTVISTRFWENSADSHSPPCLHSWLCLPKDNILQLSSIAFWRPSLICNHHTVLHCVLSGSMSSSLLHLLITWSANEVMKWSQFQHRFHQNFSFHLWLNPFFPVFYVP